MFDLFHDMYLEIGGVDSEAARKERAEKAKNKRKSHIIFTPTTKAVIVLMGLVFLGVQLAIFKETVAKGVWYIIATCLLCLLAIAVMICILIKRRQTEITAAILIAIFIIGEYAYMLLNIL